MSIFEKYPKNIFEELLCSENIQRLSSKRITLNIKKNVHSRKTLSKNIVKKSPHQKNIYLQRIPIFKDYLERIVTSEKYPKIILKESLSLKNTTLEELLSWQNIQRLSSKKKKNQCIKRTSTLEEYHNPKKIARLEECSFLKNIQWISS